MKFMISMNDELRKKVDDRAKDMYMSRSGFISMCVAQYFTNNEVVGLMKDFPSMLSKMEELQKKGGNTDGLLQDFQGKQD